MKMNRMLAASIAALLMTAQGAAAQDWQQRKRQQQPQQQQQQQQPGPPQSRGPAACVPSGFARLSRNCSVNTGGCQQMPGNCSLGWCCP